MTHDVTFQPRRAPKTRRWRVRGGLLIFLGLLGANLGVFIHYGDPRAHLPAPQVVSSEPAPEVEAPAPPPVEVAVPAPKETRLSVARGQTVAQALFALGVPVQDSERALASLQGLVDFRRLPAGHMLAVTQAQDGALSAVQIERSVVDKVRAERDGETWRALRVEVPVTSAAVIVRGEIETSLWEAMVTAGEDPRLAVDIAEIFAWDIDFYSDVQKGDSFAVKVEKRYVDGQLVSYGAIFAARFVCGGTRHEAFAHVPEGGAVSYYDGDGKSLRKQLLKSPLKFGNVTSSFGMRRHPILGYSRAHNGIDYGVPTGTPVWAVGDARVLTAGWRNGYGKYVELRHTNGWVSEYGHLSRVLVRAGQKVSQKDVIARTGSTGLSTGPHLHYGLKHHGKFVNPAAQKFARGAELLGEERRRFLEGARRLQAELDDGRVAGMGSAEATSSG